MPVIKLGGANIKKSKSPKLYLTSDNSEMIKRKYKHKILEADERSLWAIYNALAACVLFGFYPYEYSIFKQINPFNNKLENNEIDKLLKKQDE
ncbi:hypothetical protein [Clostridium sp. JS66]|uniref:hypothetical protein n=1 Tax=Clostridium sp. JS66 TaxID=3064705 RepID=UPI00298DFBE3|nr:hypothetical protein [Clostridium sp. JS66]WPC42655.1 hypothetical protein Q6H37_04065 [Clostridium sp. JS66]